MGTPEYYKLQRDLKIVKCDCCHDNIDTIDTPKVGKSKLCYFCYSEYADNEYYMNMSTKEAFGIISRKKKRFMNIGAMLYEFNDWLCSVHTRHYIVR